jgi:hypothetical protein
MTMAGSEPYLAEAARELMSRVGAVRLLAENSYLSCIDLAGMVNWLRHCSSCVHGMHVMMLLLAGTGGVQEYPQEWSPSLTS